MTFDLPTLQAVFTNTKIKDLQKLISSIDKDLAFEDKRFVSELKNYVCDENIEIDRIFDVIDRTYLSYKKKLNSLIHTSKKLRTTLDWITEKLKKVSSITVCRLIQNIF